MAPLKASNRSAYGVLWVSLLLALAAAVIFSLKAGPAPISILKGISDFFHGRTSEEAIILFDIRLPRTILGILVGGTLGLAGAAMQGFLRNPLAEPGILGVTGGAVLGAVLVFYSGLSAYFHYALPLGGMIGALVSVLILYLLAGYFATVQTLILAGVALNTLAFSGTSLALNLSSNPYASLEIVFWQMGSLADRSMEHVWLILPFLIAGWILLLWNSKGLDALALGEETASSLGVSVSSLRMRLIFGTALAVGACVSVCGSIPFIGLVIPHLLRPFVKNEPAKLLGVSALGGAILLVISDVAVRLIPCMTELKLGVLTSLVGAPFFVLLIVQYRRKIL